MMDYEKMWSELKERVLSLRKYYIDGDWCSIAESVEGEKNCDSFLQMINKVEEKYK